MYKLQVTADKLNIRNSPNADQTFANWVGEMNKDETFTAVKKVKGQMVDGSDDWYVDNLNRFTAAAWVTEVKEDVSANYPWWITDYGIDKIWATTKGDGIKIAILDSGIESDHYALKESIQKTEYAAYNNTIMTTPIIGDCSDVQGHGTRCAGMITAFDNANLSNCTGSAPNAKLLIYKIYNDKVGDDPSYLITGISKAITDKADIISISRAIDANPDVIAQIQNAIKNKIFVIVSGGNNPDGINPLTSIEGIIRVGGISNQGNDLLSDGTKLNAAGTDIINCYAPGISIYTTNNKNSFCEDSGTSFATPFVAGLFALKLSKVDRVSQNFYNSILNDFNSAIKDNSSNFKTINPQLFIL